MRGVCSECGLEFAWVDVMRPGRDRVPGFVEHARGKRQWAWSVARTAWMAARPWVFWGRVKLHMEPRVWRAAGWVAAVCVGAWAIHSAIHSFFIVLEATSVPGMTYHIGVSRGYPAWYYLINAWVDRFAAVWYTPGTGGLVWTWGVRIEWTFFGNWVLLASTVLWPVLFVLLPHTRRRCRVKVAHLWRAFAYSWVWLLVLDVAWMLGWVHRAWHNLAVLIGWSGPGRFRTWFSGAANALGEWERSGLWFIVPVWLWLWVWWWMAIGRGFKLPHALGVAAALGAINGMLTALAWCAVWIARVMG